MYGSCNILDIPPPVPFAPAFVQLEEKTCSNAFDPAIWGEGAWLFLHLGSLAAEENIGPEDAEKYWGFIEGLPLMMPCKSCAVHASEYIMKFRSQKRTICSSRDSLLSFFVNFHNSVNARSNKPLISEAQIKQLAAGRARICRVKYF
jgi:hypothetical protein